MIINIWHRNKLMLWLYQYTFMLNWSHQDYSVCNNNLIHCRKQAFCIPEHPNTQEYFMMLCVIPVGNVIENNSFSSVRRTRNDIHNNMLLNLLGDLAVSCTWSSFLFQKQIYAMPVWVFIFIGWWRHHFFYVWFVTYLCIL